MAAAKRCERQSSISIAGTACRAERHSASATATAAKASAPMVRSSPQPHTGPWEIPSAAAAMPAPSRRVPTASGRRCRRGAERGISRVPATIARPTGTLMRNSARQPTVSTSTPPIAGPGGRGERAGGAPQPDRRRAALRRRVHEHDGERRGDHRRRRRALECARHEQELERGSERAREREGRERRDAREQQRAPADDVGHPPRRGEQRGEHDRVDRDQPGGGADRGAGEVAAHVGDGEVRDGRVEQGQERRAGGDEQHAAGGRDSGRGCWGRFGQGHVVSGLWRTKSTIVRALYHIFERPCYFLRRWNPPSTTRRSRAPSPSPSTKPTAAGAAASARASRSCRRPPTSPPPRASKASPSGASPPRSASARAGCSRTSAPRRSCSWRRSTPRAGASSRTWSSRRARCRAAARASRP